MRASSPSDAPHARSALPTGIGLGLRWAFLQEAQHAQLPKSLAFFEFSPENYMRRGGEFVDALERVAARRPMLSHGLMLNLGGVDPLDGPYLDELRSLLARMGIRAHSDHLCWSAQSGRCLHELMPLGWSRASLSRCVARAREVSQRLGCRLSVENISAYALVREPGEALAASSVATVIAREAAFLHALVRDADAGLLLDVNNVWVNAHNHGFDAWAFIESLPLHAVTQLHIAGGQRRTFVDNTGTERSLWIDTHGTDVPAPVLSLMRRLITRLGPLPVLYERDSAIPPFETLLQEVELLDEAYHHALESWPGSSPPQVEGPSIELPAGNPEPDAPRELADRCLAIEALSLASEVPGYTAPAPFVYRSLVRAGLSAPIREFFSRSAARLGPRFDALVQDFLAHGTSPSPYLRDVPTHFAEFACARLQGESAPLDYIGDLVRHELVSYVVSAAPPRSDTSAPQPEFALARGVEFDAALRIQRYAFAVHELSASLADHTRPASRETQLLVYRHHEGQAYRVRYLELSAFAQRMVLGLMRNETLEVAVRAACETPSGVLSPAQLDRCNTLLADLVARGIVRGAARV